MPAMLLRALAMVPRVLAMVPRVLAMLPQLPLSSTAASASSHVCH